MLLAEQVADDVGLLLPAVEMRAHSAEELGLVGRAALAQRVGLDILVEQLIRVDLRAVGWLNPQAWTSEAKCADPLDKWLRLLRRETLRSRA